MKQGFHKTISIFMALLTLVSTGSLAIDMHFCGDTLVDYSLTQNSKTCGMEKQQVSENLNTSSCDSEVIKTSCCSNKHFQIDGQDDLKHSDLQLEINTQVFIASFVYSYLNLFELSQDDAPIIKHPYDPLITRDVQLLHQSFLI